MIHTNTKNKSFKNPNWCKFCCHFNKDLIVINPIVTPLPISLLFEIARRVFLSSYYWSVQIFCPLNEEQDPCFQCFCDLLLRLSEMLWQFLRPTCLQRGWGRWWRKGQQFQRGVTILTPSELIHSVLQPIFCARTCFWIACFCFGSIWGCQV